MAPFRKPFPRDLFLSPHHGDECLFGSFIITRYRPLVVICTAAADPDKAARQNAQTACAMATLGTDHVALGIPDAQLDRDKLRARLEQLKAEHHPTRVYAPAVEGGDAQHDLVGAVAREIFCNVLSVATLDPAGGRSQGDTRIIPTVEETKLKAAALDCYADSDLPPGHGPLSADTVETLFLHDQPVSPSA
jgi:hypothetical protein